jgi:hypothetical protein
MATETLKYSDDGLCFSLIGSSGKTLTEETQVPETGVAYLATLVGPRVITFPNYAIPGPKPAVNQIFSLVPVTTVRSGQCASADDIAASFDCDEDDDEEEVPGLDEEIDDEDLDDDEDDEDED